MIVLGYLYGYALVALGLLLSGPDQPLRRSLSVMCTGWLVVYACQATCAARRRYRRMAVRRMKNHT